MNTFIEWYYSISEILNIVLFTTAVITCGIAVWLSRKVKKHKRWLALLMNFIYPGLGHIYIRQYGMGVIYIAVMYWVNGVGVPMLYLPKLLVISISVGGRGSVIHFLVVLFVWFHSIWYVNRLLDIQKRMEFMNVMYSELHDEIEIKKKLK